MSFDSKFHLFSTGSHKPVIYLNSTIATSLPETPSTTWKYHPLCEYRNDEFISLYTPGKTLAEVCPEHLKASYSEVKERLQCQSRAIENARISLKENNFFRLLPEQLLIQYGNVIDSIIEHVVGNIEKPENYDILLKGQKFLSEVETRRIKLNLDDPEFRSFISDYSDKISYKLNGTITGRLTTAGTSFPILTLRKRFRKFVEPQNDLFVELDVNGMDARVLLALGDFEQPEGDIHSWVQKSILGGKTTRDRAKEELFSWLYSGFPPNKLSAYFKPKEVLGQYYENGVVKNPWGSKVQADEYHALNYLIQRSAQDLMFEQIDKLRDFMKGLRSYVAFTVHDSVVLDMHNDDLELTQDLIKIFSETRFGNMLTNVSFGKTWGELQKL